MSIELVLIGFLIFFVAQVFILIRIILTIKSFTRMLLEFRMILKYHGFNYTPEKKLAEKSNTCNYCKYRVPYIDLSGKPFHGDFYYNCKKRNIEIKLSDTCKHFKRDYQLK